MFAFKTSPSAIFCEPLLFRSFAESSREILLESGCGLWIPRTPSMFASAGAGLSKTDHSGVLCRKVDLRATRSDQSASALVLSLLASTEISFREIVVKCFFESLLLLRVMLDFSGRRLQTFLACFVGLCAKWPRNVAAKWDAL